MLVPSCGFGSWDEGAAAHEVGGLGVGDAAELSSEDGCVTEPSSVTREIRKLAGYTLFAFDWFLLLPSCRNTSRLAVFPTECIFFL